MRLPRIPAASSWSTIAWTVIVLICVARQPWSLGFYVDDWPVCAAAAKSGPPFSAALLGFVDGLDRTRPGMVPLRFVLSSLFRDHTFLWQAGLVIANIAMALVLMRFIRLLSGSAKAAVWIGLGWVLLPWNAAGAFWPTYLPAVVVLVAFGLLCILVIQGWECEKHRAVWAAAIYLWICLSYEAFYFQWIAVAMIGLAMARIGRARRRDVVLTAAGLLGAQVCAAIVHVLIKPAPGMERPIVANWPRVAAGDLLSILPTMFRSAAQARIPFAIAGVALLAMWAWAAFRPDRRILALAGCFLAGAVLSIVAFALGGRGTGATGTGTHTLLIFTFWFVAGAGVATAAAVERAPRITAALLIVLGATIAAGHVMRMKDWAAAWAIEKADLDEAPVAEMEKTAGDATIVFGDPQKVDGAPIFTEVWDLNAAMHWKYPGLGGRSFVVDQSQISGGGAVYLWKPSQHSFSRAGGGSLKNRRQLRQHLIHNRGGDNFQFLAAACAEVERARLIAADHSGGFGAGAGQGHRKSSRPRKAPAAGDGDDYGNFGHAVELLGRHHQYRSAALLLVTLAWIGSDQPDLAALH